MEEEFGSGSLLGLFAAWKVGDAYKYGYQKILNDFLPEGNRERLDENIKKGASNWIIGISVVAFTTIGCLIAAFSFAAPAGFIVLGGAVGAVVGAVLGAAESYFETAVINKYIDKGEERARDDIFKIQQNRKVTKDDVENIVQQRVNEKFEVLEKKVDSKMESIATKQNRVANNQQKNLDEISSNLQEVVNPRQVKQNVRQKN